MKQDEVLDLLVREHGEIGGRKQEASHTEWLYKPRRGSVPAQMAAR